jgi:hypothetical protein
LRNHGWQEAVVVQSFDWEFVREAHALAPELVLGALGPPSTRDGRKLDEGEKALSLDFIREIAGLGARLIVWNRQVDATAIAFARERGLRVWVYTINQPAEAEALARLGVEASSRTTRRASAPDSNRNPTKRTRWFCRVRSRLRSRIVRATYSWKARTCGFGCPLGCRRKRHGGVFSMTGGVSWALAT